ncbi:MAG TPA: Gfo/Idh/MocA family oxidoreductase [Acidimicrobiia bacterium]|nr:Gfo/Idh/MocA family oxidoreductase [Acidimicrobiia bacterium]
MTDLRVGVIGTGVGLAHLFAIGAVDRMEIGAVCDVDETRAEKSAADFGAPAFGDPAVLFASGSIDAVVIATPGATHAALTREALDAGLHVYCEKPITPTSDEGYALARYARDRDKVLVVGFQHRYNPRYVAVADAVRELGPLRRFELRATNWFRSQHYFDVSPWRATWRMAGGGVLMNQAIHQLDALIAIAGMPTRVSARVSVRAHRTETEDEALAWLEWHDGATGSLVASLNDATGEERFQCTCERGAVVLSADGVVRRIAHDATREIVDAATESEPPLVRHWQEVDTGKYSEFDMFKNMHRNFAAAILDGAKPRVDGEEGTQAVELANAIYMSSVAGEPVDLPLDRGAYPPVFEELSLGDRSI